MCPPLRLHFPTFCRTDSGSIAAFADAQWISSASYPTSGQRPPWVQFPVEAGQAPRWRRIIRACVRAGWATLDLTWLVHFLPTLGPQSLCLFHHNRPRKENVVLQVNVLVKIGFKVRQRLVERLVADASVGRSRITTAGLAHSTQCVPSGVVLVFHHGHGVLHAAKRWWQNRFLLDDGLFHPHYVDRKNPLFFHHVCRQFLDQGLKACADLLQFRMVLPVDGANLF